MRRGDSAERGWTPYRKTLELEEKGGEGGDIGRRRDGGGVGNKLKRGEYVIQRGGED